jgi:hypothetical protein
VRDFQTRDDQSPKIFFGQSHFRGFFVKAFYLVEEKHTALVAHGYTILEYGCCSGMSAPEIWSKAGRGRALTAK